MKLAQDQVFTLKQYKENEAINLHTENAVRLVEKFGTDEELIEIKAIARRHDHSRLSYQDYCNRYDISSKYYKILVMEEQ